MNGDSTRQRKLEAQMNEKLKLPRPSSLSSSALDPQERKTGKESHFGPHDTRQILAFDVSQTALINPLIVEQCKPNKSATSIWL